MKRIFLILFSIWMGCSIYAQDCDRYHINTPYDDFDSITDSYRQILLQDVDTAATKLPDFKDMAACWIDRVKDFEVFKSYTIPDEAIEEHPDLIFLIFNSQALASRGEKQSWFNLMPTMNENHMYRLLYDIPEREMLKINKLKYKKREKEIHDSYASKANRLAPESELKFLGSYNGIVDDSWHKEGDVWINHQGDTIGFDSLITATKFSEKDIIRKKDINLDEDSFEQYIEYIEGYMKNLKDNNIDFPKDSISQRWVADYWRMLMRDCLKNATNRDRYDRLDSLANLSIDTLISDKKLSTEYKSMKLFYQANKHLSKTEYASAADYAAQSIDCQSDNISPQEYIKGLFFIILCYGTKPDKGETGSTYAGKLEQAYLRWYEKINKEHFWKSLHNSATTVTIMLTDYYTTYGRNDTLINIVEQIRDSLTEAYHQKTLSYGKEDSLWYAVLNDAYLNGSFDKEGLDSEILIQQIKDAGITNVKKSYKAEYFCYYCLYQIIHWKVSDINSQAIKNLLDEIFTLTQDPEEDAFFYIEKFIQKDLKSNRLYENRRPYVIWNNPDTTHFTAHQEDLDLKILLIKGSENIVPYSVSVRVPNRENPPCDIKRNSSFKKYETIWTFSETVHLSKNENNDIYITYKDMKGHEFSDTLRVSYEPYDYDNRKDIAILFAVQKYECDGFNNTDSAIVETERLAQKLYEYGFDTIIIRDPNRIQILDTLKLYTKKEKEYHDGDQLLVYFSGHGYEDPTYKIGYIVPRDGCASDPDATMITYHKIAAMLNYSQCKHVLFYSDACYSGSFLLNQPHGSGRDAKGPKEKLLSRYFIGSAPAGVKSDGESAIIDILINKIFTGDAEKIEFHEIQSALLKNSDKVRVGSWGDNQEGSTFIFTKYGDCINPNQ